MCDECELQAACMSGENLDEEKRNKSKIRIELYSDNTRLFMDKQDYDDVQTNAMFKAVTSKLELNLCVSQEECAQHARSIFFMCISFFEFPAQPKTDGVAIGSCNK